MVARPIVAGVARTRNVFVVDVAFDTSTFRDETDRAALVTTWTVNNVIEKYVCRFSFVRRITEFDSPSVTLILKLFRRENMPHKSNVMLECSTKLVHDTVQQVSIINYVARNTVI